MDYEPQIKGLDAINTPAYTDIDTKEIQFNNAGSFGSDANFFFLSRAESILGQNELLIDSINLTGSVRQWTFGYGPNEAYMDWDTNRFSLLKFTIPNNYDPADLVVSDFTCATMFLGTIAVPEIQFADIAGTLAISGLLDGGENHTINFELETDPSWITITSDVDIYFDDLIVKTRSVVETFPTLLKLDQTTQQTIDNGTPIFNKGLIIKAGEKLYLDG